MSKKMGKKAEMIMQYYSEIEDQMSDESDKDLLPEELLGEAKNKLTETSLFFIYGFIPEITAVDNGFKGKLKVFIQRVIRKLSKFIYLQYNDKIYAFQTRNLDTMGYLCRVIETQEKSIAELRKVVEDNDEIIKRLTEECKSLDRDR